MRLLLLAGVGAALTLAIGFVAFVGLWRAADLGTEMELHAQAHELASRIRAKSLLLGRHEKDLLLGVDDPRTLSMHRRHFADTNQELRRALGELEAATRDREDRAMVARLRASLDAYELAIANVHLEFGVGRARSLEQVDALISRARVDMQGIETTGDLLEARARARQREAQRELSTLSQRLAVVIAIASVMLGLAGLVFSGSVNLSIARPLRRTLEVLEAVAAGDLSQQADGGHTDEMGRIATALNTAVQRMRADRQQIERLAATDALTQLMNRRAFSAVVRAELTRSRRYGYPVSFLLLDIDKFKSINDRFGHATGDLALKRVGAMLKEQLRTSDVVARWGGEEFVAALPHVGVDGAAVAAARIRVACGELGIVLDDGVPLPVTVSIGVTELQTEDTLHRVIERADRAMYLAKSGGRNRVIIGEPEPPHGSAAVGSRSSREIRPSGAG